MAQMKDSILYWMIEMHLALLLTMYLAVMNEIGLGSLVEISLDFIDNQVKVMTDFVVWEDRSWPKRNFTYSYQSKEDVLWSMSCNRNVIQVFKRDTSVDSEGYVIWNNGVSTIGAGRKYDCAVKFF